MMTDEKKKNSNDEIMIELRWKSIAILLAIILFIFVLLYCISETNFFVNKPCDTLAKQIIEDKYLWTQQCGFIILGSDKEYPLSDTMVSIPQYQITPESLRCLSNNTGGN